LLAHGPDLIENGAVQFHAGRIETVGAWRDIQTRKRECEPVLDVGEAILSPGFINAHCHLDLEPIPAAEPPIRSFTSWARQMVAIRAETNAQSFLRNSSKNARDLLRAGCSTIVDIGSEAVLSSSDFSRETGPNLERFVEITGVLSGANPQNLVDRAVNYIGQVRPSQSVLGIAPHAPYTTKRETLLELARRPASVPLTMHLAESIEEFELFQESRGTLWDWLFADDPSSAPARGETPIEYLDGVGLLRPNLLIAHANVLTNSDMLRLRRARAMVAHCPRTHRYFGRPPFPLERFREHGIPVCLSTDSLASTPCDESGQASLSLLEEVRQFSKTFPNESPQAMFEMITRIPGAYPGFRQKIGSLHRGYDADFSVFDYSGPPDQALESLLGESTRAREMWIRGVRIPIYA